jgi:type I restriction enzyme S subunit
MTRSTVTKLGEVLTESRHREPVAAKKVYPMAGVFGFGRGILLRAAVSGAEISAKHLYRIKPRQIIYSRLKAFEGAFALVPKTVDGRFVTNEFPTFDVDTSIAEPEFIALVLSRRQAWEQLSQRITGVGARRERLRVPDFLAFELNLPSLAEQHRVVAAVSTISELRDTLDAEARAGFALVNAAVEDFLRTEDGWDQLPKSWTLATLGEVADVRSGITKGRKTKEPLSPVPFIRAANVQNGYLDLREIKTIDVTKAEAERFALQSGDVLMIEGGNAEHLGRGWVWEGQVDGCLHQNHVFRARPDRERVDPRFLAYAISASPAREYCLMSAKRTTNLASINKTQMLSLPVPVPPLSEQRDIVATLDQIREAAVAAQREAEAAAQVRAALVDALVSGTTPAPDLTAPTASAHREALAA